MFEIKFYILGGSWTITQPNRFGNNVLRRSAYLPTGAKKSWIDYQTDLPNGRLLSYNFYVHDSVTSLETYIRLQIWRPVGTFRNKLVWEKRIRIHVIGAVYNVSMK